MTTPAPAAAAAAAGVLVVNIEHGCGFPAQAAQRRGELITWRVMADGFRPSAELDRGTVPADVDEQAFDAALLAAVRASGWRVGPLNQDSILEPHYLRANVER